MKYCVLLNGGLHLDGVGCQKGLYLNHLYLQVPIFDKEGWNEVDILGQIIAFMILISSYPVMVIDTSQGVDHPTSCG